MSPAPSARDENSEIGFLGVVPGDGVSQFSEINDLAGGATKFRPAIY